MYHHRRLSCLVIAILAGCLLFIIFGINTYTVTYHIQSTEETYEKTYVMPFWQDEYSAEEPAMMGEANDVFSGWFYDEKLTKPVEAALVLKEDIQLYGDWIQDNPDTDFKLPEIHVTSKKALEDIGKYAYEKCDYTITNTFANNCLENVTGEIRGRGNSTWIEFDKKSYKIKFEEKQDLFQMGEDKTWVLLSNSVDYTLMRNEIALGIGQILDLDYTSECQWVHLFYNGEYRGIYLLCEQVETGIHRVDIETPYDAEEIDTGFLLEIGGELAGHTLSPVENAERNWDDYATFIISYPESDLITKHQDEYMDAYLQLVNAAILTKDWENIIDLVDIESFAKWYLVNEIMLNGDMGWSMFAYKPQGDKMYLGPIWDFDQCCGNSVTGGEDYETWYPDAQSQNAWFNTLIEMEEFRNILGEIWDKNLPEIQEFIEKEKETAVFYRKDIDANFERWQVLGTAPWRIREEIGEFKTYQENADYLFEWLDNRIEWMNEQLSNP